MLITPRRALSIILEHVRPLPSERRSLPRAVGLCLAREVRADRDLPPTDRSAMDGYAVRAADLVRLPRTLRLIGEVAAGSAARPLVRPGTCAVVLTGAVVPPGADTVVQVEQTRRTDGGVVFFPPIRRGANVRRRGEEVRKGRVVLPAGTVLGAPQIGLCASVGKAVVRVHRRPRAIVLCTGRELRTAGQRVGAHQLRDSNGPALSAALAEAGYDSVRHRILPDDPEVLTQALSGAAEEHEVVILTGGVSVGRYDFVPDAVRRAGAVVRFHGVLMKPGKPQLYATLGRKRHVFGLPGNPLSVMVGFHELLLPALRRLSGFPARRCRPVLRLALAADVRAKGTRAEYQLARLVHSRGGTAVRAIPSRGSADLVAGAKADGVIVVPRNVREIPAGRTVEFRPWRQPL